MNTSFNIAITEELMLRLVDTMAASATSFSAHGYDQFILARDIFISTNHQLFENISTLPMSRDERLQYAGL